jgi:hypothetical protein
LAKQQVPVYQQCLQPRHHQLRAKKQSQYKNDWLAFINIDEFIVLKDHGHAVDMLLETVPSDKAGLALSRLDCFFNETQILYKPAALTKRFQM